MLVIYAQKPYTFIIHLSPVFYFITKLRNEKTIHSQSKTTSHTCQCEKWGGLVRGYMWASISGGEDTQWVWSQQRDRGKACAKKNIAAMFCDDPSL